MFERFEFDLERLVAEKTIPLLTINIIRDLTQLLAKIITSRVPTSGTAILIELEESVLPVPQMHGHRQVTT